MATILPYIQIILSVVLIVLILMQQSEAGLGSAFGGGDGGSGHHTRRGSDRVIFIASIVVGALFALSAIVSFLL
jgi:protein translocase SecG subunit